MLGSKREESAMAASLNVSLPEVVMFVEMLVLYEDIEHF